MTRHSLVPIPNLAQRFSMVMMRNMPSRISFDDLGSTTSADRPSLADLDRPRSFPSSNPREKGPPLLLSEVLMKLRHTTTETSLAKEESQTIDGNP